MAGFIASPLKPLLVHHDCDSDDLSPATIALSSAAKAADIRRDNRSCALVPSVPVANQSPGLADHDDDDPFEFLGARQGLQYSMCSPSAVFTGGRVFPTQAAPAKPSTSSSSAVTPTMTGVNNPISGAFPVDSRALSRPPLPMSRRSRSEALRRPARETAAYNRSTSVEGRSSVSALDAAAAKKGDYRRLQPASGSNRKTTSSGGATTTCSIDAVPSCGPRPRWYAFAAFATVKPPQGGMDIKDIRTRQKKRNTQQQKPADVVSTSGTRNAPIRPPPAGARRKSWLLNSLSCRVDVDALAWSPSHLPLPLP